MTQPMTPAALNLALAGLLGVDLRLDMNNLDTHYEVNNPLVRALAEYPGFYAGLSTWNNRHGKSYQSDIEAHVSQWRRYPPPYSTDLVTAFTLGEEMRKRGLEFVYGNEIEAVVYKHQGDFLRIFTVAFQVAHASAYDRALAAFRALGGTE